MIEWMFERDAIRAFRFVHCNFDAQSGVAQLVYAFDDGPELVEAVRSGTISINAAATVASLPPEEQVAAVAGGKKLLRQAAKEIREQRAATRTPREPKVPHVSQDTPETGNEPWVESAAQAPGEAERLRGEIASLKQKVAQLQAENVELNQRIATLIDAS